MHTIGKRIGYLDYIKGCLMFLVIWGHVCPNSSGANYADTWCALARINSLFLMSLFFMISGYLLKPCSAYSQLKLQLRKIVFRLVVPIFSWGVVLFLITSLAKFTGISNHSFAICDLSYINFFYYIKKIIGFAVNSYWFISCLIICICFGSVLYYIKNQLPRLIGHIILYASIFLIPFLPINLFHFTFFWPFFIIGSLVKDDELVSILSKKIIEMPSYCLILLTLLCVDVGYSHMPIDSFYYTNNHPIWWLLLRFLVYFMSSVCAFIIFRKVYYSRMYSSLTMFMEKAGKETMFLYMCHMVILFHIYSPIVKRMTNSAGVLPDYPIIRFYLFSTIFAIILFVTLYYMSLILNKNALLRTLFLGHYDGIWTSSDRDRWNSHIVL